MNTTIASPEFLAPVQNERVEQTLQGFSNEYDLLSYVKNNISFFLGNQLINAEWFERFSPDLLEDLHIYTKGFPCVETRNDFNAVVIDCNLDLKTYNDCLINIRLFGKSYGSIFLNSKSSGNIKAHGISTVEVYASDHSQACINLLDKSKCFIEAHKSSFVAVRNRSRGCLKIHKGESNVIIH